MYPVCTYCTVLCCATDCATDCTVYLQLWTYLLYCALQSVLKPAQWDVQLEKVIYIPWVLLSSFHRPSRAASTLLYHNFKRRSAPTWFPTNHRMSHVWCDSAFYPITPTQRRRSGVLSFMYSTTIVLSYLIHNHRHGVMCARHETMAPLL